MAHVVNRTGKHGTGNLKENEAGTRIDVGLRPVLKCGQQHDELQSTKQQRAGAQNAHVARWFHEAPSQRFYGLTTAKWPRLTLTLKLSLGSRGFAMVIAELEWD
jgi:hypothetical protein